MASDRNLETVEFIELKPVHRSSLSVSQNHGFANKLGLSVLDSARMVDARALAVGIVLARLDCMEAARSHMKSRNAWRIRGKGMSA